MQYLLLFYFNNGCTNAHKCNLILTLAILFKVFRIVPCMSTQMVEKTVFVYRLLAFNL